MKPKIFFIVVLIVFIKGSISSPLDLFTNPFLSVETKDPIEATIQTTQVPQTKSAFEWQSQADNISNVKYPRNEQNKFYNDSKIERPMIDREEKEKTGRPPLRNEPDVHEFDSNSIGFEKDYYHEDKENKDDFEEIANIFGDKISINKEFETEGSGFGDDFVGIKGRNFEIEGSGDEIEEDVKEKSKDLKRRKGKHGFSGIIVEKIEDEGNKTMEILNLEVFGEEILRSNDSEDNFQENTKIGLKNDTENENLFAIIPKMLMENKDSEEIEGFFDSYFVNKSFNGTNKEDNQNSFEMEIEEESALNVLKDNLSTESTITQFSDLHVVNKTFDTTKKEDNQNNFEMEVEEESTLNVGKDHLNAESTITQFSDLHVVNKTFNVTTKEDDQNNFEIEIEEESTSNVLKDNLNTESITQLFDSYVSNKTFDAINKEDNQNNLEIEIEEESTSNVFKDNLNTESTITQLSDWHVVNKTFNTTNNEDNQTNFEIEIEEESTLNLLKDNLNTESTITQLENESSGNQITPLMDIMTLKPITEDEWLKIINSSPNELVSKQDDVLEFLGLEAKTVSPPNKPNKQTNKIIDIDPFQELTTTSQNKTSILVEKLVGNGKFNSENISFIENDKVKIESANIISAEDDSNETTLQEDLNQHKHVNLDDYLSKLWPDLKQKEKVALKALTKNVKLETLAHYDLKYLLKNIGTQENDDGITQTYENTYLKSNQFDENVEICFVGTIGYQFILITQNNELESPKYLDRFNKICVNSYEPILIIQQESSYLELKFKILHDVITLQSIHVNVNGKDVIDNVFKENLNDFNALIGGNIKIDQLKLGDFNRNEEGLSLVLFDVNLSTEMYLNGRLIADNLDDEEEGTTTLIISASVGVFSVSFLVIIVLIYQFCLKNKSRKMIYILTHR